MEMIIVFLLLIVAAVILMSRKKPTCESHEYTSGIPAAPPEPEAAMERELERRMAEFMERDLFSLVIQPVVDFRNNSSSNGEALSRLNHPERGVIFPDNFLPAVDVLGLYPRFDRYIFQKTCAWLSRSLAEGVQIDCISCNFSRKTLSEKYLARELIQIADRYGLPHRALGVEITERERETDARQLLENLKQLKEAGFRIILDDYGNGVTSVNDLTRYPLDIVKIDRSMLLEAQTEQGAAAFMELVSMAAQLGAEVVCEGIETEAQDRFARDAGCHYGQGFLYFRPIAQDQVFELMRKSSILEEDA